MGWCPVVDAAVPEATQTPDPSCLYCGALLVPREGRSVTALVGQAWRLWSRNLGDVTRIMAVFVLPVALLQWLIGMVMVEEFREVGNQLMMTFPDQGALTRYELVSSLVGFVSIVAILLGQAACIALLWHRSLFTWAIRAVVAAAWTLIGVGILAGLGILFGLLLFVVPGIYLAVRWLLAPVAVIDQNRGPVEALRRSGMLIRGHWWPTFGTLVLVGLIGFGLELLLAIGIGVVRNLFLSGATATVSFAWFTFSSSLVTIGVSPLYACVLVAIYRDLTWRKGGPNIPVLDESGSQPPIPGR